MDTELTTIDQIEAYVSALMQDGGYDALFANAELINSAIEQLVQKDSLKTSADFGKAGAFVQHVYSDDMDAGALKYQLLLTAVSLGDRVAVTHIPWAWDALIRATGRDARIRWESGADPQRTASIGVLRTFAVAEKNELPPATGDAADADNAEVSQLMQSDQEMRHSNWTDLTETELNQLMEADRSRLMRMKEIVATENALNTANDFANAALVFQHGHKFEDYASAHELAICALMLGDKDAAWLCGASYDRMLLSASYPQRFCTQLRGNPAKLRTYTTSGINDTMRVAVVRKSLTDALSMNQ